jgi:N-carbamoylputrescine amidase
MLAVMRRNVNGGRAAHPRLDEQCLVQSSPLDLTPSPRRTPSRQFKLLRPHHAVPAEPRTRLRAGNSEVRSGAGVLQDVPAHAGESSEVAELRMGKLKCGLIQMGLKGDVSMSPAQIRDKMIEAHVPLIEKAAASGVQVLCLQEIFTQPYFCPSQDRKWYAAAEPVPDGHTTRLMQEYAKKHQMVMVVPVYEEAMTGVYYNTAAVIDADGKYLGKYRKTHIPQVDPGFYEKFFFKPGDLGYPVFQTAYVKLGVYICYDRHFPEGWRALALNGAEYIVNPSATVAGLSKYLWELEQPASAAANGVFIGAINRVGREAPWSDKMGEFYGSSYIVNPLGKIEAQASYDQDELLVHEIDLDLIRQVRNTWQFFRDRRPDTYGPLVQG